MRKIYLVARREYQANVRTKSFIIGILMFPILLLASTILPTVFQKTKGEARRFAVLDLSGEVLPVLEPKFASGIAKDGKFVPVPAAEFGATPEERREGMRKAVDSGSLFAMAVIGESVLDDGAGCSYYSKSLTEDGIKNWLAFEVSSLYRSAVLARAEIDPAIVEKAQRPVAFAQTVAAAGGGERSVTKTDKAAAYSSLAFVYLLWMSIFMMAQGLLTGTIEEKSARTVEVVLSSCTPFDFMAGKILGLAAVGLTLIASWIACFFVFFKFVAPAMMGDFLGGLDLGSVLANPANLAFFAIFFLFGFLLYASIFVGIGSVCNTITEAQNLMGPVTILLIVPLLSMMHTVNNPDSALSIALTYVPVFTPFVAMNRVAAVPPPSTAETLFIVFWLVLWTWLFMRGAAKVFRIGILLYGKPPKLREIVRWARAR